ncbi:acylphosphatase [Spiribacter halobius]|uniref:acylphosphatase n=1 Tax=Sediminicurvatus halobius TaxID=2182432 RepID=A0A2U2MW38_9GAMM|nr:acylphosphatase [Spiribacter halobius]PWG61070.1 acylphosphatase [Spiribacter halobius]UEX77096.1 acylphosphatase [Spiribacter halobius]
MNERGERAPICRQYHVHGRVQGVGFRASARSRALQLGLRGSVRNLPDGRVALVACGTPQALDAFEAWLREGPPGARVEAVDSAVADDPGEQDFRIA